MAKNELLTNKNAATKKAEGGATPHFIEGVTHPKWKYHAKHPARVVHTPEEELELEGEWHDKPLPVKAGE